MLGTTNSVHLLELPAEAFSHSLYCEQQLLVSMMTFLTSFFLTMDLIAEASCSCNDECLCVYRPKGNDGRNISHGGLDGSFKEELLQSFLRLLSRTHHKDIDSAAKIPYELII